MTVAPKANTQQSTAHTPRGRRLTMVCLAFCAILVQRCSPKQEFASLDTIHWIHGSEDCTIHTDPPIQVVQFDESTWILRQNKCVHYEAPFMYLFIGQNKALLMDTGATEDSISFPLYETVSQIIHQWQRDNNRTVSLVVAHSHGHSDHYAADNQFEGKPNTKVVGLSREAVRQFFHLSEWPTNEALFDLGRRSITILPLPGHDEVSLAVYDKQTQLLLTGDTFYPGRLYVRDWPEFKASIQRLQAFTENHPVRWLVGNHIEMKDSAGLDYPTGSTFQPHEHRLPLTPSDLEQLHHELVNGADTPRHKVFDKFIVVPKETILSVTDESFATLNLSGYPDFLAAEGDDVWVTNTDKIQKLTLKESEPIATFDAPEICGAPVVAFGSLWAADCKSGVVMRLDMNTGKIIARVRCGVADPEGEISLASGAGSVWIMSDKKGILSRINPSTNKIIATINVKPNSYCAAFGFGAVWISNSGDASVQRIDPTTNRVTATISVGPVPRFLSVGEQGVWTLNQGDGTVTRINPVDNTVVATIDCQAPGTGGDIDAGGGRVWIRAKKGRMLQSIDPSTNTIDNVYGPLNGSGAVRVAGRHVWVTAHDVNTVWVLHLPQ